MKKELVIAVALFLLFAQNVFAKDISVSGRVIDNNNNPIVRSSLVFSANGKTVKAALTDTGGNYTTIVPEGTYSITVNGPEGTKIQSTKLKDQLLTSDTVRNFTLAVSLPTKSEKKVLNSPLIFYVLGILAVLSLIGGITFFVITKKKKQVLPEASSPH